MSLMEKIFGDLNEKEVKKVSKIADRVMTYDEDSAPPGQDRGDEDR